MKNDVNYLLGALRTIASVAKERGLTDLYGIAQAGLDLYGTGPVLPSGDEDEIECLRSALAVETHLKNEWIAEYAKLRDGVDAEPTKPH